MEYRASSHSDLRAPTQQPSPPSHPFQIPAFLVAKDLPLFSLIQPHPYPHYPTKAISQLQQLGEMEWPQAQVQCRHFVRQRQELACWPAPAKISVSIFVLAICVAPKRTRKAHLLLVFEGGEDLVWVVPFTSEVRRRLLAHTIIATARAEQIQMLMR
jgi:hypothetical protein